MKDDAKERAERRALLRSWCLAIFRDGVNVNAWEKEFTRDMIGKLERGWDLTPAQEDKIESIYAERTP